MSFDKTDLKIILGGLGAILLVAIVGISLEPQPTPQPASQNVSTTQNENPLRRMTVGMIEEDLLRAGYDVEVKFIQEDDSQILIAGKQVNRSFAHRLMAEPRFRRVLRKAKFSRVTFMDSITWPGYVEEFKAP